jgi:hypothetical protein
MTNETLTMEDFAANSTETMVTSMHSRLQIGVARGFTVSREKNARAGSHPSLVLDRVAGTEKREACGFEPCPIEKRR